MHQILVIDDDVELCELVAEYLEPEGYKVEAVHNGEEGVERALSGQHALAVLDFMLPGINGFEVLRRIRARSRLPIVMLTARGDDVNRIVGLQIGADDYLPKPFNPLELVARISAVLRRTLPDVRESDALAEPLVVGDVQLANRVDDSAPFVFDFPREQRPVAAQRVRSERCSLYTLVAEMQRRDEPLPPRPGESGSYLLHLRMMAGHLLPVLLVGGLFCYLLARYLSTPIVTLRATTRALADGNLTARVDKTLLGRYDEIGNLGRDFNLMASRIEALVEAQRRLLGDISHELRSPLARQGVALGLARRRSGPEVSTALDRIGREAERINEMIGQLLTLSRAESGADGLNKVKVDLCPLVQEVADDADFEARNRERSVRVRGCEACAVPSVPELLRSAVENIVRNAVRHTAKGTEVEVNLHCERNASDEYALISVRDHGPGVPEESLREIFRPFYRVEDARDRQTGGTGLGLAITARAVRLHSGTIKASNASDGGLVVEIKLPLN